MIISHRHKFIFIKTRKTGGTSVEQALARICGPEDILTPDHLHRGETDELASEARNWEGRFSGIAELAARPSPLGAARVIRDVVQRPKFYNHIRASSVRARVPRSIWNGYYKFCFERNSWDKTVSFFFWANRRRASAQDFNAFLIETRGRTLDQRLPVDWERYSIGDRQIVDEVFQYDDLEGNLRRALASAGVAQDVIASVALPKLKSNLRQKRKVQYTNEGAEVVRQAFGREIARYSYTLPDRLAPETRSDTPSSVTSGEGINIPSSER